MSNKITLICQECDEPFEVFPSVAVKRKFCGQTCRVAGMRGVARRGHSGPKPILICPECDEPFETLSASQAKLRKYCSLKCRGAARQNRVTLICKQCEEPFEVTRYWVDRRKFCSRKCSSLSFETQNIKTQICPECDKPFEVSPGKSTKFCSQDCNLKYRSRKTTLICERCNESFEASLQRVNRKFCSKCYEQSYERRRVTVTCQKCDRSFEASAKHVKRCPDCRIKRVTLICTECEEPFKVFPSQAARRKFCSRECMSIFKRRGQVTLICAGCDEPFKVIPSQAARRKFCSYACRPAVDVKLRDVKPGAVKSRGTVYQQVISGTGPRLQLVCKNCGDPFERTIHSALRDFCIRFCNAQWVEKETVSRLTQEVLLQAFTEYTSIIRVAGTLNATPDHIKIAVRLCGYKIVRKGTRSCMIPLEGVI